MTASSAARFALIAALLFVVGGVVSAVVIRKVMTRIVSLTLFIVLALTMWTQRINVRDCAGRAVQADTTCSFFGFDVNVKSPRPGAPTE